jgi:hypothetical protein
MPGSGTGRCPAVGDQKTKRGETVRKYNFEEITLDVDTSAAQDALQEVKGSLGGLSSVLGRIKKGIADAFSKERVVSVSKELLVLRLAWGKFAAELRRAVAPIAAVVLPVITQVVYAATRLAKQLGKVIRHFFGITEGAEATNAAIGGVAEATKRSLAGFDQIQRMDSGTGANFQVSLDTSKMELATSPLMVAVEKIRALLEPILNIDFTPLQQSMQTVAAAVSGFAGTAGQALKWLFDDVLAPGYQWLMEELVPQLLQTLASALGTVTAALAPLQAGVQSLFAQLQPVVGFLQETALIVLQTLQEQFVKLTGVFTEKSPQIQGALQNIGQVLSALWTQIQPILALLRQQWQSIFSQMGSVLSVFLRAVIDGLYGITEFLAGIFTGDWERVWNSLGLIAKAGVNLIIGLINTLIDGAVQGINRIIEGINQIQFTAPDWVPFIGGKSVGFRLPTVKAPQIPYLARGAVLPANRPFLAMVGDQHHGTNIEAPLATIQEAVANVMQSQTGAMMAGFEASVQVQRQILEAVLGIQIGDDMIANACDRYHRKLAVMRGG